MERAFDEMHRVSSLWWWLQTSPHKGLFTCWNPLVSTLSMALAPNTGHGERRGGTHQTRLAVGARCPKLAGR